MIHVKAYRSRCEEVRTDNGDDAWGFAWNATVPQRRRCRSVVELREDTQENEIEEIDQDEEEVE